MRIPIQHFSVAEFGLKAQVFCNRLKPVFKTLQPDLYDVKAKQIDILKRSSIQVPVDTYRGYYEGLLSENSVKEVFDALSKEDKRKYMSLVPFRFRAVSSYKVLFSKNSALSIKRHQTNPFAQKEALVAEERFDIRKWNRIFPELSDEAANILEFRTVLEGVSKRIHSFLPNIKGLNLVIHHVKVRTLTDQITSNSPEGLHQDGFPFIVSALVVERKNIHGAESQIFEEGKKNPLYVATLQPGSGLLQPDLGTSLWHLVTPIYGRGHRCSIGFDIQPIEE